MALVAVFIDHDIIVRHFILSGVLSPLEREHDVVYVFPEGHRRVTGDPAGLPLGRYRTVPVSNERLHGYRRLYHATVLRRLRGSRDKKPIFKFWRHMLGPRAFFTSWCCSWPLTYEWYRRRALTGIGENKALSTLLAEEKPDVIIHPTVLEGLFVADLIRWGEAHGIPTVYLMNSWDNPATKAMTIGSPAWLVVWGEHSRQLAHQRLGIALERILVFGAAQFDVYRRPPREGPAAYRARLGVPADHRLLLYAGSSKGLDETRHLLTLERAVEEGELPDCTVLYRPHPWRGLAAGERDYFSLPWKHVVMAPDMAGYYRRRLQGENFIYMADYEETHVTLSAVDAVVSPLSTILLEAALHGKPIAAYLPDEDMQRNIALFSMTKAVHFREFFERVDCIQCERPEDLVKDCWRLLEMAEERGVAERLRAQCAFFVEPTVQSYAEKLTELVRTLATGRQEARAENPSLPLDRRNPHGMR